MLNVGGPQFLYMAEAAGRTDLVSTRAARIKAIINYIIDNDIDDIDELDDKFDIEDLTPEEQKIIYNNI